MSEHIIKYTFIPLPFLDTEDGQYKPSVKVLVNGQFESWQVWDLGFDEPRFAMPYARQFAAEMKVFREQSIAYFKKTFND